MNEIKQKTQLIKKIFNQDVIYISQGLMSNVISPILTKQSDLIADINIAFEASYGYASIIDSRDGEKISFGFKIVDAKFIGVNRYLKFKLIDFLEQNELKKLKEIIFDSIKGISKLFLGQMLENELILENLYKQLIIKENDGVYFIDFSNLSLNKLDLIVNNLGITNIFIKNKRLAIELGSN